MSTASTIIPDDQLTASLFVAQFVILSACVLGLFISQYWKNRAVVYPWYTSHTEKQRAGLIDVGTMLVWFVVTIAPLLLTTLNSAGWQRIGITPPMITARSAAGFAFWSDLIFATWIVFRSGGWQDSPFTSVLVAVPTFAILLEESPAAITGYIVFVTVVSGIFFLMNVGGFEGTRHRDDRARLNLANWLLSSIMLVLTAWMGMFGAR